MFLIYFIATLILMVSLCLLKMSISKKKRNKPIDNSDLNALLIQASKPTMKRGTVSIKPSMGGSTSQSKLSGHSSSERDQVQDINNLQSTILMSSVLSSSSDHSTHDTNCHSHHGSSHNNDHTPSHSSSSYDSGSCSSSYDSGSSSSSSDNGW